MPVLYFDTTKASRQGHKSGLNRVSASLLGELGSMEGLSCRPVRWSTRRRGYVEVATRRPVGKGETGDAFFTPEVFALRERPFSRTWLKRFRGRRAVVFYDAIPFYHPETTWPRSVRRFPRWFADLEAYDRVLFISGAARDSAREVSRRTGLKEPEGPVLRLGADYRRIPPERREGGGGDPVLLSVGILEPRKGQQLLLDVCEGLWSRGQAFKLVLLGRINPHFGKALHGEVKRLQALGRDLVHEAGAGDDRLAYWHGQATLVVQPSRAEGFGLPVLEALWAGCPVACTRQPCLEAFGEPMEGLQVIDPLGAAPLREVIEGVVREKGRGRKRPEGAVREQLPTWRASAEALADTLYA
ncbi:MAG TPA: glycosyltransferase [Oceanipulchritudo sp.]|nr:glycosyltransferase [Oceanipulchritudo sp.]